jgi:hypothetical protein
MWVQVGRLEDRVSEGEDPQMLAEVAEVMEGELKRLFGQEVPMDRVIYSGRSFPEDGHSIIGFLDEAQKIYAEANYEYPVKAGVAADPLIAELGELKIDSKPLTEIVANRKAASELVDKVGFDN